MKLSDLRLGLASINYDPKASTVKVIGARLLSGPDQVVNAVGFDILTGGYSRSTVKCPLSDETRTLVDKVQHLIRSTDAVEARLVNPEFRAYAMMNSGNLFSGVSIKADTIELVDDEDLIA